MHAKLKGYIQCDDFNFSNLKCFKNFDLCVEEVGFHTKSNKKIGDCC